MDLTRSLRDASKSAIYIFFYKSPHPKTLKTSIFRFPWVNNEWWVALSPFTNMNLPNSQRTPLFITIWSAYAKYIYFKIYVYVYSQFCYIFLQCSIWICKFVVLLHRKNNFSTAKKSAKIAPFISQLSWRILKFWRRENFLQVKIYRSSYFWGRMVQFQCC